MPKTRPGQEQPAGQGEDRQQNGWQRTAQRYGPFVVVAVLVLAAIVVFRGNAEDGGTTSEVVTDEAELIHSGPMTHARAELEGVDPASIDFGPNCDPGTQRIKLPTVYAAPCVERFDGDNGGATAKGVTEDTIKLVLYVPKEDFLVSMITGQGVDFDPTDTIKVTQDLVDLYNQVYETYGRKVELEVFTGSGGAEDLAQAQADAIEIAEMDAFAVVGGPFFGNIGDAPFVDELAARGVVCLPGCSGAELAQDFVEERDPYVWPDGTSSNQSAQLAGEAIASLVGEGTAELAGDPELQQQERVYGLLHPQKGFGADVKSLQDSFRDNGIELAEEIGYSFDIGQVQEEMRTHAVRFRKAGVTTVIVTGAPFVPGFITNAATVQDYYPEWILGPNSFADTRLFAQQTDQVDQWQNGFGIGYKLGAHTTGVQAAGVYEWAYGDEAVEIPTATPYLPAAMQSLFTGIHLAGPELTPHNFRDGLFRYPPSGDGVTSPVLSWGDHGTWPEVDYGDADDAVLIWWDADATGHPNTQWVKDGVIGVWPWVDEDDEGFYRLANGGQRYELGEFPGSIEEAGLFDDESSLLMYGSLLPPETMELYEKYEPPNV